MNPRDIMLLSWRQLKERKLRTILTILAVAVGVTTILALSAQVEGVKVSILSSFEKLGPNTIIVSTRNRQNPFTDADVAQLRGLSDISNVAPILSSGAKVAGLDDLVSLIGTSSTSLSDFLGEIRLSSGNIYLDVAAPQTLLGNDVAFDEAGQPRYMVGQTILVQLGQGSPMLITIVGILDVYGSTPMIQADTSIFIPIEYLQTVLRGTGYTYALVKASTTEMVDALSEQIGYMFGERVQVTSMKQITDTVVSITNQINLLLVSISGTSLIAASLGTLNIMMISVLERVREIGVIKSLGMRNKDVLALYMVQGALIGVFGSLTGLGLGSGTAYAMPFFLQGYSGPSQSGASGGMMQNAGQFAMPSFTPVISLFYVVLSIGISIFVTLLSSAYPAYRASKLSPVEALRYE